MRKLVVLGVLIAIIIGCAKVPLTGRRQLKLLPTGQMSEMSAQSYQEFLSQNDPLPASHPSSQRLQRIGEKIAASVEKFLADNGYKDRLDEFDWKFNVVPDETVNAWCMPGGRVVFYTGILPICDDDNGIAVVMGHEIAHAVARHGNERMSQAMGIQAAGMTLGALVSEKPELTQQLLLQAYGVGSQLGSLAFSREHESEADKLGLVFMAMAGYDPRGAPEFWKRMQEASGGGAPPEFMSTHPSHDTRIEDLNAYMEEALKYYNP
jgi:predicted Zn-dependent protease